ncbi:cytochrome c-type biogenesis protein [Shewanella sp. NIFS-20-20]|uniref:cytochrome c-type biogenesis protein n=1 Tax=Shewanella sp. NIFS-20-20 TaxID=2853806 RepID=UPI001C47461C|nr:cytochrome c-type biogenesis protein [Shewanella sp. NIFS-20-20]MBV7316965.1 cytochrome c-type biogenesis protein CcmH [Shewanella sp. NIFS-20-20]
MKTLISLLLCLLLSVMTGAVSAQALSTSELLQQAKTIAKELRCPKTVNQSLYESEAPIANELKGHIYQMLQQGKTKADITQFMVERYGEQIHYRPGLTTSTLMLWFGPGLLLAMAVGFVLLFIRQQGRAHQHLEES